MDIIYAQLMLCSSKNNTWCQAYRWIIIAICCEYTNRPCLYLCQSCMHSAKAYSKRALAYYLLEKYDQAWEDVRKAQDLGLEVSPEFLQNLSKVSPPKVTDNIAEPEDDQEQLVRYTETENDQEQLVSYSEFDLNKSKDEIAEQVQPE